MCIFTFRRYGRSLLFRDISLQVTSKAWLLIRYGNSRMNTLKGFYRNPIYFCDCLLVNCPSIFDNLILFVFEQGVRSMEIEEALVNLSFLDAIISKINCQKACCFIWIFIKHEKRAGCVVMHENDQMVAHQHNSALKETSFQVFERSGLFDPSRQDRSRDCHLWVERNQNFNLIFVCLIQIVYFILAWLMQVSRFFQNYEGI